MKNLRSVILPMLLSGENNMNIINNYLKTQHVSLILNISYTCHCSCFIQFISSNNIIIILLYYIIYYIMVTGRFDFFYDAKFLIKFFVLITMVNKEMKKKKKQVTNKKRSHPFEGKVNCLRKMFRIYRMRLDITLRSKQKCIYSLIVNDCRCYHHLPLLLHILYSFYDKNFKSV